MLTLKLCLELIFNMKICQKLKRKIGSKTMGSDMRDVLFIHQMHFYSCHIKKSLFYMNNDVEKKKMLQTQASNPWVSRRLFILVAVKLLFN